MTRVVLRYALGVVIINGLVRRVSDGIVEVVIIKGLVGRVGDGIVEVVISDVMYEPAEYPRYSYTYPRAVDGAYLKKINVLSFLVLYINYNIFIYVYIFIFIYIYIIYIYI